MCASSVQFNPPSPLLCPHASIRCQALRIPLILHGPSLIPKPVVVDHIVANLDIGPTILDAVGAGDSFLRAANEGGISEASRIIDGTSLLPLVSPHHACFDPRYPIRSEVFCEIYSDRSIITQTHTLVDLRRTHYYEPPELRLIGETQCSFTPPEM